MGLLARLSEAATGRTVQQVTGLQEQLAAERETNNLLAEAHADLEQLYAEDVGWRSLAEGRNQFTPEARDRFVAVADVMTIANPLIKRGVALRTAYVWGQGVTVTMRDDGAEGQDLGAVWREFWEDPTTLAELSGSEAQVAYERRLATRGEAFFALPTDQRPGVGTGRVRIRHVPAGQIKDRITDPNDAAVVQLYKRVRTVVSVDRGTGRRTSTLETDWLPALGFRPAARPTSHEGHPIRWDIPLRAVAVNRPDEDWRGVGDVLAALPWARMDKEFVEDLAAYMRALTRILGQVTGKDSRRAKLAASALSAAAQAGPAGQPGPAGRAGQWAVTDPGTTMSLVSKSGAQISHESHRPLATMVAAALEVPLTMLLGDPGISGARATAETLDFPTELMARLRQQVHEALFRDVAGYVIDQAVIAPRGPLTGTVTKDGDRLVVTLPDGDDRTLDVSWPEYDSTPLKDLVDAIAAAEELPALEKFKLYAKAFRLGDVEKLIDRLTDDQGNWIGEESAGQAATDRFRRGEPTVPFGDPSDEPTED